MQIPTNTPPTRRVLLLETDERAGLVAAIAAACASQSVSLDIATGPGHVLLTFAAPDDVLYSLTHTLSQIGGVADVFPYQVAA